MRKISILWVTGFAIFVVIALVIIALWTIIIDPFFHYHKPRTDKYFYVLNNERSQNNGIIKHFDYQGIITGTSMAENFKTSEAEQLWGNTFVKVCFSGGTFKEINDNLVVALKYNPNLHIIIRSLELSYFEINKDKLRLDLGAYPTYLYDNNIFNDIYYIFNRDIFFSRIIPMIKDVHKPGITPFDQYSNWMKDNKFGKNTLYPNKITMKKAGTPIYLSDSTKVSIIQNVHQNITSLAAAYPKVTFYYFFTPYSAKWWQNLVENGKIYKQVQIERVMIEEILKYKNIKLFSFNNFYDIITNLNNYKDAIHHGEWINSLLLKNMFNEIGLLTVKNYEKYLDDVLCFYTTYDYINLNEQIDYDDDYQAASLINY